MTFTATDYDTLVDAPTEMGNFDVTQFEVEGKPHYFVATPAGSFNAEKSHEFTQMVTKIVKVDSELFGGLPYEKYVIFFFFASPESNAGGALEHLNSFVAFVRQPDSATPKGLIGAVAHDNDAWIAATAFELDATVVTRDRDFTRIQGLPVEDWSV